VKAADYLKSRGWLDTGTADDGVECWADPTDLEMDGLAMEDALTIQRARDAAEERRCVAEAIANAASRFAKLDTDAALSHIMQAAATAQAAWLRMYGVEVES